MPKITRINREDLFRIKGRGRTNLHRIKLMTDDEIERQKRLLDIEIKLYGLKKGRFMK